VFDKAVWKGALGAAVMTALLASGWWTYQRYREFVVMREVIAQILEQARTRPAPPANATPATPR